MAKRVGANRLKSMKEKKQARNWKKTLSVVAFSVIALCVMVAAYFKGPQYWSLVTEKLESRRALKAEFEIQGCSNMTATRLRSVLDSAYADSLALMREDIESIASKLSIIEKIDIRKGVNGKTRIRVFERKPVAIVSDSGFWLMDKNGVKFPVVKGVSYELPLVIGLCKEKMPTFMAIKNDANRVGDGLFGQISQINVSRQDRVTLSFRGEAGQFCLPNKNYSIPLVHMNALRKELKKANCDPVKVDLRYNGLAFATVDELD